MRNNKVLHEIVDNYVRLLRDITPNGENLVQQAATLAANLKQDLISAGAEPLEYELLSAYRFLCFKAEKEIAQPDDYAEISLILRHHLRVEYALLQYLKAFFSTQEIEFQQGANFSENLDILKNKMKKSQSEFSLTFFSGLSEIESVRSNLAQELTYKLRHDDMVNIRQFVEQFTPSPPPAAQLAETYALFCNYCYDHFVGGAWGHYEFVRKMKKLPEPEPDWQDFVRSYSFNRGK